MSTRFVDVDVYTPDGEPLATVPSVLFFVVYDSSGTPLSSQPAAPVFSAVPSGPVGKYTASVELTAGQFFRMRVDKGVGSTSRYEDFTVYADDVTDRPTVDQIAAGVWAAGTRTLTSFGTLVSDVVAAVWGALLSSLTVPSSVGEALSDHLSEALANVAPTVSNFSPEAGTPISQSQAISFDVTDDYGLFRRIMILVSFSSTDVEVVYDGDNFRTHYTTESTKTSITNGSRFSITRTGGWPSTPTFEIYPIDTAGNEGS